MLTKNKIQSRVSNNNFCKTYIKRRLCMIILSLMAFVPCSMLSGCYPAVFAASAILINQLEKQEQNRKQHIRPARTRPRQYTPKKAPVIPPPTPEQQIEKARLYYHNLQWQKSTALLKDVLTKPALSQSLRWEALVLLGAMEYQNGNTSKARSYFVKAHKENGTMPSRELFPPVMVEFYQSVR